MALHEPLFKDLKNSHTMYVTVSLAYLLYMYPSHLPEFLDEPIQLKSSMDDQGIQFPHLQVEQGSARYRLGLYFLIMLHQGCTDGLDFIHISFDHNEPLLLDVQCSLELHSRCEFIHSPGAQCSA
jgi:hypothetical protein